jgi:hypothetical protein
MNLFPKILLLSCIITSGLRCANVGKDNLAKELEVLLKALDRCAEQHKSRPKNPSALSGTELYNSYLCQQAEEAHARVIIKINQKHSDINLTPLQTAAEIAANAAKSATITQ